MSKGLKRTLAAALALLAAFILYIAVGTTLRFTRARAESAGRMDPAELAAASKNIDLDKDSGSAYVNNEVVIVMNGSVSEAEAQAYLAGFDAEIDEDLADVGIYRLVFEAAMSRSELEDLVGEIQASGYADGAYISTLSFFETESVEIEPRRPAYPDDEWDGDSWSVSVPRGSNWGMEAIDAPGAWAYLDVMSSVRVGLIDALPQRDHPDLSFEDMSLTIIDKESEREIAGGYGLEPADHGSHVSGILAARWGNGEGVSGVMGDKGELYYSGLYYDTKEYCGTGYGFVKAIKKLLDQDVQVINISMSSGKLINFAASRGNRNAIDYLTEQARQMEQALVRVIESREAQGRPDFVICVGAGNENNNKYYPDDDAPYGYREEPTFLDALKEGLFINVAEGGGALAKYSHPLALIEDERVRSRVIVVGGVQISGRSSSAEETRYACMPMSNVGERVDVMAPGNMIYSCKTKGYGYMSGTSMATPHAAGVAGLVFASNGRLTGPEVKQIVCASTTGRYSYEGGYCGLVNARLSVENALKSVETSVNRVLKTQTDDGLDLCFVVDTTGSMDDDIQNAKDNMARILDSLAAKTENYRVALIDYRDFPWRTGDEDDYPCALQLDFSEDNDVITQAIYALDLGYGGDNDETVYSGLMKAVSLNWRSDAKKVIIIMGDAAPLDPEPETGYTYDSVCAALFNAAIGIDFDSSDGRVTGGMDQSMINVFSIGTDASDDAESFFREISDDTGGSYAPVEEADGVGDAIVDSIEQIEVVERIDATADFGEDMAEERIELYTEDWEYLFTVETDRHGRVELEDLPEGTYMYKSGGLSRRGKIMLSSRSVDAEVTSEHEYSFAPMIRFWREHKLILCLGLALLIALCAALPFILRRARGGARPGRYPPPSDDVGGAPVCPRCGRMMPAGARFCASCGMTIAPRSIAARGEVICANCGAKCRAGEKFCGDCGAPL